MANVLSQNRMAEYSKWSTSCDADRCHKTGRDKDLCHNATKNEGVRHKFVPTKEGSHACVASRNIDSSIFGKCMPDDGTESGKDMCHVS